MSTANPMLWTKQKILLHNHRWPDMGVVIFCWVDWFIKKQCGKKINWLYILLEKAHPHESSLPQSCLSWVRYNFLSHLKKPLGSTVILSLFKSILGFLGAKEICLEKKHWNLQKSFYICLATRRFVSFYCSCGLKH